jgi:hypothetical protein
VTDVPLNPVDLENQILDIKNRCHKGVQIFTEKHRAFLEAETAYEHARAYAFLEHDGPQTEKRHAAEIGAAKERQAMDLARVEFEYTKRKLEVYMAELSALQNLNRGVRTMYAAERGFGG